ncbi:MAG: oligosaccharide flippase family protein [Clostridia bacterium]|nr:oligosaccharide flippase family protein [Clostridia bacterium]
MKEQSKGKAILVAYLTTGTTMLSSIALKPLYISRLGIDAYGLFVYVQSIVQIVLVMDLGLSSVMVRYLTEYRTVGDKKGEENFGMHALIAILLLSVVVMLMCLGIMGNVGVFVANRPAEELPLLRRLIAWMFFGLGMIIWQHYFDGALLADDRFVFVKFIALVRVVLKAVFIVVFILSGYGILGIALGDALSNAFSLLVSVWYTFAKRGYRVRWHGFDRKIVKGAGSLMLILLMQSVVLYANNSINKIIIGIFVNTAAVAVYEIAMTFVNLFSEVPTITNSVYLPLVTRLVVGHAENEKLDDLVIRVGRYQFIICGIILGGIVLFGRQFIGLWTGGDTVGAWTIALILIVPSLLPLVQNICLSILTAKDKRMFRSCALLAIAVINVVASYFLVQRFGIIGAAIGTGFSLIIGNNIAMNIYYVKVIGLNIKRIFSGIFKGILPCLFAATAVCSLLLLLPGQGFLNLLVQIVLYCMVCGLFLVFFGLNSDEKALVDAKIRDARRRFRI